MRLIPLLLAILYTCIPSPIQAAPKVKLGVDRVMDDSYSSLLKGKRIGLITNQTGVNGNLDTTVNVFKRNAKAKGYKLVALFAPEHGIDGSAYAYQTVEESKDRDNLPIYSLYGKTHRPTDEMLKGITLLVFDIQDIGARSYTFITTMFYAMEEAAKKGIPFVVLDRPNPINGITIDGPMMEEKWRSPIGYIDIPYCHGMTVGELARFFNGEYEIGCKLEVIPMQGWQRSMTFQDTGLSWVPTSPYVPEATTALFYPTTGILGELQLVNIGIGYTLPFKVVGAPWIDAVNFSEQLNKQKFAGVHFEPFYFKPVYGRFAKEACQGVLIVVTDPLRYKPVSTQYLILGILKSLYPEKFKDAVAAAKSRKATICKLNGTEEAYRMIVEDKNIAWKLCALQSKERGEFAQVRKKYLMKEYGE